MHVCIRTTQDFILHSAKVNSDFRSGQKWYFSEIRLPAKIVKQVRSEDVRHKPTSSRSPPTKKTPFVTRQSLAFATLIQVCGGVNKYEWSDDSEEDKTNALKIEISPFDGRNVEKYAENF